MMVFASIVLAGCANDPNSVGIIFIAPNDTTSTRTLDSQADSMQITNNNYELFINTSAASSFMVGNYQSYTSKSLLKFRNIGSEYDSAVIVSAVLTLRYNDYFFQDEMGLTSMSLYQLNTDFDYSTVTFDSVSPANYGTLSQGSYSGTPADTQQINITLNNQLVRDWLEYAADTTYPVKNYGMILLPNMNSTTIKGFYSIQNPTDLIPFVTVIYTKNSVLDTLVLNLSSSVCLSDAPYSIIPSERFVLQSGIAYRNILNFDLSKLPANVIINNVNLQFTLDSKSSFISPSTDKRVVIGLVTDSMTKTDTLFTDVFQSDSVTYSLGSVNLNAMFQRWNSGVMPNLGISMKNYFEIQNLDYFVFYSPAASEINLRPRIKITYTLRN
jgi:hypothetical protein